MNKKMRELLALIDQKTAEARSYMDGENKDVSKASEILDEVDALKKEYETEKRLVEGEKKEAEPKAEKQVASRSREEAIKAFGKAAKGGFRVKANDYDGTLNETVPADGGYTVPEDIQTIVNEYRQAEFSFLDLVRREVVSTASGARTFKKKAQMTGFSKVGEAGKIGAAATPEFERVTYAIEKYAGYLPVTNELRYDSDANIGQIVAQWLGDESRATANALILAAVEGAYDTPVDFKDLDGIKEALNVTLGAAYKASSAIITNDDGLQYLDTLKDDNGRYMLAPNPSDPARMQLAAGATVVPVYVVPNAIMPTPDSGDDEGNVPFIIGDLKEGIYYFDRQQMSIAESNIAAIGDLNAFEQDLTIYRAIEREDVEVRDADAFVYGYINILGE